MCDFVIMLDSFWGCHDSPNTPEENHKIISNGTRQDINFFQQPWLSRATKSLTQPDWDK